MRQGIHNESMGVEARALSAAEAPAAMADLSSWGGTLTNCVGGHIVYGPVSAPSGATTLLDASMDWRDRLLVVHALLTGTTDSRPGGDAGHNIGPQPFNVVGGPDLQLNHLFYSGAGWDLVGARGTNKLTYCTFLKTDGSFLSTFVLFADTTDGYKLKIRNTSGTAYHGAIWIQASEQTGKIVAVP